MTDGTRVLGLGDIGPEAGLPVMEGKAMLFKYLGGVDAVPICLATKDPDELIRTVKLLEPAFGGDQPGGHRPAQVLPRARRAPRGSSAFPSGTTISRGRPPASWPGC